jgi:hypothetical protein
VVIEILLFSSERWCFHAILNRFSKSIYKYRWQKKESIYKLLVSIDGNDKKQQP